MRRLLALLSLLLLCGAIPAAAEPPPGHETADPTLCTACHSDFHFGQFDTGPRPRSCADCHALNHWVPSTVDATRHAALGQPLRGAHLAAPCARCHPAGSWVGAETACVRCHFDSHAGVLGDRCEKCHRETSFRDMSGFDHRAAGGPVLDGGHAGLACAACHGSDGQRLRGQRVTCATCHTAKHGDRYPADCAACHGSARWDDVSRFDHSRTQLPLERRHAALPCAACHGGTVATLPPASGVANATIIVRHLSPECRSCHGDPSHSRLIPDCAQCHKPDSWHLIRYDHDRSLFPLRGAHFVATCNKCHLNDIYTGTRSECVFCHRGDRLQADAKMPSHRLTSFECKDCHKPFKW